MASQGGSSMAPPSGPPYAPTTAALGGQPTPAVDDPICAVLLVFYVVAAITSMAIFQTNRKRNHKFIFSVLVFGFCMARILTLCLRIGWASRPRMVNLAIAASIFVQAGVLLLFVINLVFAQRIVRSYHPNIGWSKGLKLAFTFLYFCIAAMLIMVIIAAVYTFFTLDMAVRLQLRKITLVAGTFLALLAFLPIPIVILALLTRPAGRRPEKFGIGRHRTRLVLLLGSSFLLSLGAGFRVGVNYTNPRPLNDPAWYHSKACFYCFNFVIELLVVYAYMTARFDRRFHVPDGSSGPGHYSGGRVPDDGVLRKQQSARQQHQHDKSGDNALNIGAGDVGGAAFGSLGSLHSPVGSPTSQKQRQSQWEASALEEMKEEASQFPIALDSPVKSLASQKPHSQGEASSLEKEEASQSHAL